MEIKINLDKKTAEVAERAINALENLVKALEDLAGTERAIETRPVVLLKEEPTPEETPVKNDPAPVSEDKPEETEPVPSREEVQRLAIVKIQGGHSKAVKALVEKYGATRVGEVPEANLAAFVKDLEALA